MSTHTPGPWQIGRIIWESAPEILDEKQNLVATVPRAQYVDNAEAQANARIIAAAPDLLGVVERYSAGMPWVQLYPLARAALAKARGAAAEETTAKASQTQEPT